MHKKGTISYKMMAILLAMVMTFGIFSQYIAFVRADPDPNGEPCADCGEYLCECDPDDDGNDESQEDQEEQGDPTDPDDDNSTGSSGTYTVTYHANNDEVIGEVPIDNNLYAMGEYATVLDDNGMTLVLPIKSNEDYQIYDIEFFITYWDTDPDGCGTKYQPGDHIEITGNIDLYALWKDEAIESEAIIETINWTWNEPLGIASFASSLLPTTGDQGELKIAKEAEPSDKYNPDNNIWEWDVTVSLRGWDKKETVSKKTDIVLVIDRSESLSATQLSNAKTAAQDFVNALLPVSGTSSNIGIGLVSFAYDVTKHTFNSQNFTGARGNYASGSNNGLLGAIYGLNNSYTLGQHGTFLQGAIHEARLMLETSTADNKYIVIFSDGEPNRSYSPTTTITYTTSNPGNLAVMYNNANGTTAAAQALYANWIFDFNQPPTNIWNYGGTPVGGGYIWSYGYTVGLTQRNVRNATNNDTTPFPPNHGIPAMYEAELAKREGMIIYSIALLATNLSTTERQNAEYVLSECSSGTGTTTNPYYYTTTDSAMLEAIFASVANQINIAAAASNATVTDPIGPCFNLVDPDTDDLLTDEADPKVFTAYNASGAVKGTVTFYPPGYIGNDLPAGYDMNDYRKGLFIWDIGDVDESDGEIYFTYTVRLDIYNESVLADPTGAFSMNGPTYVDYTDVNSTSTRRYFTVPQRGRDYGAILIYTYILNDDNLPPESRTDLQTKPLSYFHSVEYYEHDYGSGATSTLSIDLNYGTSYTITAPLSIVVDSETYYLVPGVAPDYDVLPFGNPTSNEITLTTAKKSDKVYFAYRKGGNLIIRTVWDETPGSQKVLDHKSKLEAADVKVTKPDAGTFHVAGWIVDTYTNPIEDKVYEGVLVDDDTNKYIADTYIPYGYHATQSVVAVPYISDTHGANPEYQEGRDWIIIITITTEMQPFYRDCGVIKYDK